MSAARILQTVAHETLHYRSAGILRLDGSAGSGTRLHSIRDDQGARALVIERKMIAGAEPIELNSSSARGVLLLHGFGDTPQTLRYLAEQFHSAGFRVHAPLYPGHGATVAEFFSSTANEWIGTARSALVRMLAECESVSIVGLSMGAAIGAILAAESHEISSLVLIAPYLKIPFWARLALRLRWIWGPFVGEIESRHPRSVQDPVERDRSLGYGVVNGAAMAQLNRVVRSARKSLSGVTAPTLVIQSRQDPRVAPGTASFVMRRLGAKEKRLEWTDGGGHVLTVDFGREQVIADSINWVSRWSD